MLTLYTNHLIVKTVLKHCNLPTIVDQKFSKLINNYGNKFSSYQEYENKIIAKHHEGYSPWQIADILGVNGCGVQSVFKNNQITPHRSKSGPKKLFHP